ncbi:hypothetical protein BHM03_00063136 [Ensete ventricosum]|nr:hypothetical protein BHM03_00063136 [Ensete ventricosum]
MLQSILHAVFWVTSQRRKVNHQRTSVSIRCEQGTKDSSGLDVWLGRLAMVGFATAITVEISTGKGLLECRSAQYAEAMTELIAFVGD